MENLQRDLPTELSSTFTRFENAIQNIKQDILTNTNQNFGNWQKIFGDIFNDFINSFVRDTLSDHLEGLRKIFNESVIQGVGNV